MPLRRDCTQLTCASSASAWLARRPANRRRACGRKRSGCQRGLNQSLHPHAHARAQFSPAGPEGQNRLPEVVVLAERLVVEGPGAEQRLAARKDDLVQRLAPHHAGFVQRSRLALQTQAAGYRTGPWKYTDTRNVETPQGVCMQTQAAAYWPQQSSQQAPDTGFEAQVSTAPPARPARRPALKAGSGRPAPARRRRRTGEG